MPPKEISYRESTSVAQHAISPSAAAKDASRATQIALGADWACCILVHPKTHHVTGIEISGDAPRPQDELYADMTELVFDGPPIQHVAGAAGGIWIQEDTSGTPGPIGDCPGSVGIGALAVGGLVDIESDGVGRLGYLAAFYRKPRAITDAGYGNIARSS